LPGGSFAGDDQQSVGAESDSWASHVPDAADNFLEISEIGAQPLKANKAWNRRKHARQSFFPQSDPFGT
jgi:hypothetical protein